MTVLIDADRLDAARKLIQKMFIEAATTANMDTVAIKAAVDATDDWCEANAASFNTALPATFKTTATLPQKALLLAYVAMKRGGII